MSAPASPGSITLHHKYCYHCDYENSRYAHKCENCQYFPKIPATWLAIEERPKDFYDMENRDDFANVFTCFKYLPPELRLKIWKSALPGPRVVFLHYFGRNNEYRSPLQISMASACKESRGVVEGLYVKAFGTESAEPKTWFNFKLDTLYIQRYPHVLSGHPNGFLDRCKVRNLAVHLLEPRNLHNNRHNSVRTEITLHNLLNIYKNVEVLINVQQRHNDPFQNKELALLDPINIDRLLAFSQSYTMRKNNRIAQEAHQATEDVPFDFASEWPIELGQEASNFVSPTRLEEERAKVFGAHQVTQDFIFQFPENSGWSLGLGEEVSHFVLPITLAAELMQEILRDFRAQRAVCYEMPEIRQMMVTTSSMAAKVIKAQEIYRKAEEEHKLLMKQGGSEMEKVADVI